MEKSKKIRSIVAGCLAAVTLATAGLAVATSGFGLVKDNDNIQMELPEAPDGVTDENGNNLSDGKTHPMPAAMTFTGGRKSISAMNAGYGAIQVQTVTLTATVKPDNASNKKVDWAVAFVDPSSTWATGKKVTDYVTVTPSADGSATATVKCLKDFGSQIKITVTSRDNTSAKAECTVDFEKRLLSASVLLKKIGEPNSIATVNAADTSYTYPERYDTELASTSVTSVYSTYTVDHNYDLSYKFEVNQTVLSKFQTEVTSGDLFVLNKNSDSYDDLGFKYLIVFDDHSHVYQLWDVPMMENVFLAWLHDNPTQPLFQISFYSGSEVIATVPVLFSEASLYYRVESVTVQGSLKF